MIRFENYDLEKIHKLAKMHLSENKYSLDNGYVFINDKSKLLGYCILKKEKKDVKIDWIYAKKGFGSEFIYRLERTLFGKFSRIILNVSIDPNERKETVMRRINYYIKNDYYRVYDMIHRKKYGALLKMHKHK